MRVEFRFPSAPWATESVRGLDLAEPLAVGAAQYVSFRVHGDPAFASADFRQLYLYVYDDAGNFGRWGVGAPTKAEWQVRNHQVGLLEQPWDSPGLPDPSRIVRFSFFQYGSEGAIPAYTAVIHLDDLQIRDTPLVDVPATGSPILADFEYANAEALAAAWSTSPNAVLSLSTDVAPLASGPTSLRVEFQFPSAPWATETATGPLQTVPSSLAATQYLSFRVKGDPAFAGSDFRQLYLYVYDDTGNFGRWGEPIPITATWQIRNHTAATLEKPWDSPALPNLARISRIAFFQYGSETARPAFTAAIQIDDVVIRDTPLVDAAIPTDTLIDDFEYESDEALAAAWIGGSPNAVVTTSNQVAPGSAGRNAMKVEFNFASTPWVTEFVRGSARATPIAVARTQYLGFRVRGDPAFAASDFHQLFLYAYDNEGNFGRWGGPVPDTDAWQIVNYLAGDIAKPWDSPALPNLERLVRFAFFQYGSEAAIEPYSAAILVDDLGVRSSPLSDGPADPPAMAIRRGTARELAIDLSRLVPGRTYLLRTSSDLRNWTTAAQIIPTQANETWPLATPQGTAFYVLQQP